MSKYDGEKEFAIVRLVFCGFQDKNIYKEFDVSSSIINSMAFRWILSIINNDLSLLVIDVKTTILYGDINDPVSRHILKGVVVKSDVMALELRK